MLKERPELEEALEPVLKRIKTDKKIVNEIKQKLAQNKVTFGQTQRILNGDLPLSEIDLGLLCLLTSTVYEATREPIINPTNYFTEKEIKTSLRRDYSPEQPDIEFPIVLEDVLMLSKEDYITTMPIKQIVALFNANILDYNFETQRNAKLKRRKDKIIMQPNINPKSVNEIEKKVLENTFLPDTITFNVLAGSGTEGDELFYDASGKKLIIYESEIDILDGFHRITAFVSALRKNPSLEFTVQVAIKNYNIRKAQSYVAQINTINKMDRSHLKALKAERYSDFIVKELQRESDLRGKISQTVRPSKVNNQLVSFLTLADAIDTEFNIESKMEAMALAEYLTKFFDYLVGSFPDAFIDKIKETSDKSMINHDATFAGYITLARRIKEKGLPMSVAIETIKSINFDKNNPLWEKEGILEEGRLMPHARKKMQKLFEALELRGVE